jgi:heme/copper-type cytochrome/quinol oxidase subunit 2
VDTPTTAGTPQPLQGPAGEVTLGDWMITLLLSFLPIVNIVMLFVWSFGSNTNPSKANWAKATLIWMLIGIVLAIVLLLIIGTAFFSAVRSME